MNPIILVLGFLAMLLFAMLGLGPAFSLLILDRPAVIRAPFWSANIGRTLGWTMLAISLAPFVILFGGYVGLWWVIPFVTIGQLLVLFVLFPRGGRGRGLPPDDGAGVPSRPHTPTLVGSARKRRPR